MGFEPYSVCLPGACSYRLPGLSAVRRVAIPWRYDCLKLQGLSARGLDLSNWSAAYLTVPWKGLGQKMASNDPVRRAEVNRRYYEAHKDQIRTYQREWWKNYQRPSRSVAALAERAEKLPERRRKGESWRWILAAWEQQGGRCYLCGDPISLESEKGKRRSAQIEHDHRCCGQNRSCPKCRRGLACGGCNSVLGMVNDNLDRLELIARNARQAWAEIEAGA
jgi:hypothetical protein